MNARLMELSERRAALISRAALEREGLACCYGRIETPLRWIDYGLKITTLLRSPVVLAGLAALLVNSRWRKWGRVPSLLMKGWRLLSIFARFRK
jgi:hypothetical protein